MSKLLNGDVFYYALLEGDQAILPIGFLAAHQSGDLRGRCTTWVTGMLMYAIPCLDL